jgi:hypothetical protein
VNWFSAVEVRQLFVHCVKDIHLALLFRQSHLYHALSKSFNFSASNCCAPIPFVHHTANLPSDFFCACCVPVESLEFCCVRCQFVDQIICLLSCDTPPPLFILDVTLEDGLTADLLNSFQYLTMRGGSLCVSVDNWSPQLSGTLQVYKLVRPRLEENYAMGADFKCAQCTSTIPGRWYDPSLPSDSPYLKARYLVHQSREPRHLGQDHHPEVSTGLLSDQDLHLLQTKVWKMRIEEGEKMRKAMKMHTILMCSFRSWREYEGIFSLLRRSSSILRWRGWL